MAQYFLHIMLLCLWLSMAPVIQGAKILFVSAPGSASHRRSLFPLAEALGQRGHQVTMTTELFEDDDAYGKNITNKFTMVKVDASGQEEKLNDILWNQKIFSPLMMIFPWSSCSQMTEALLDQKRQDFNEVVNDNWDLIFVDALFTPSGLLYANLIKKPYVLFETTVLGPPEATFRGIPYPASSYPAMFVQSFTYDHNSFVERLLSFFSDFQYVAANYVVDYFIIRPKFRAVAPSISVQEFFGKADSNFIDYPTALDYPRPMTPDMITIGGKCKTAILKDKDMLTFVEDPKSKGTIVVAFGHMVKWNTAPEEAKQTFAKAMNRLTEYRVIWQYKGEPPIKMADHVKTMAWLPQTELLNHPRTVVFLSHAGLKSVMEAICGEVPMVLVPFFAEQIRNGFLLKRAHAGEMLEKLNLTEGNILTAIHQVANNQRYRKGISDLKWSVLDKPITPKDNAIFWTEFLVRHQGMPKKWFQIKGYKMCWFTYYNLDIILAFSVTFLILSFVIVRLIKITLSFMK